jgi:uncharacterized protein YjbI with pentapeptide repeats
VKFEINYSWSNDVKIVLEGKSRNDAIKQAIIDKKDLRGCNLSGSDLRSSDLRGCNLSGCNLRGCNLSGSDLRSSDLSGSDLRGCNLRGSNLSDSDLSGSDLSGSDLRGSSLRGSDLSGSSLRGSDLRGSSLRGSDLQSIRDDLWAVLSSSPNEVEGLLLALKEGRIDGSTYTGMCACLIGTLANIRHCNVNEMPVLKQNSYRPAERFFLGINKGDIPKNNQFSKLAVEWIEQWLESIKSVFGGK